MENADMYMKYMEYFNVIFAGAALAFLEVVRDLIWPPPVLARQ